MHPSTALATVLIDELVRCGVTEMVLCPGSRSAPLAYAVLAAEQAGRLRLHVRVDERTAGFLALGLAKMSRHPAAVITTSGTAVANLHPAVLEASHACVPLIVMSADRPAELRGTGANQTTTQPGIFAGALRFEHDQPPAQGRSGERVSWRSTVCRAHAAAVGHARDAGPVHLNVAFRDPLAPDLAGSTDRPESLEGRDGGGPWVCVSAAAPPGATSVPTTSSSERPMLPAGTGEPRHARTLMLLGDLPDPAMAAQALTVAQQNGWPVIAEPFGDRGGDCTSVVLPHGPLVLADLNFVANHLPDRVLTVGRLTLHRECAALLRMSDDGLAVEQVSATAQWSDPAHVVSHVHSWSSFVAGEASITDQDWAAVWRQAGQALAARLGQIQHAEPSGVAVAGAVLAALGSEDTLVVGSSNAPRDLSLADPGHLQRPRIVGNRGLAGIDGTVSTALGIATSGGGDGRTVALMGDLTFEHDLNGLLIGPNEPRPDLLIVVVNDGGGGIFATLEYGDPARAEGFERLFGTPTGTDLGRLCAGMGVAHQAVGTLPDLAAALHDHTGDIEVIEVTMDAQADQAARRQWRERAANPCP